MLTKDALDVLDRKIVDAVAYGAGFRESLVCEILDAMRALRTRLDEREALCGQAGDYIMRHAPLEHRDINSPTADLVIKLNRARNGRPLDGSDINE